MRVCAEKGTNVASSCVRFRSRKLKRCFARTTMLRPSGVSSANELNCAASASSRSLESSAGTNVAACRLPKVIVPVQKRNQHGDRDRSAEFGHRHAEQRKWQQGGGCEQEHQGQSDQQYGQRNFIRR